MVIVSLFKQFLDHEDKTSQRERGKGQTNQKKLHLRKRQESFLIGQSL